MDQHKTKTIKGPKGERYYFCVKTKRRIQQSTNDSILSKADLSLAIPTGTCGQDPMVPLIAHFPLFFNIDFVLHVHNILQLSMYHYMTYIQ